MMVWLAWITVFLVCAFGITHGQPHSWNDCLDEPKGRVPLSLVDFKAELNKKKLSANEVFAAIMNAADYQLPQPVFMGYDVKHLANLEVYHDHQCKHYLLQRRQEECTKIQSLANEPLGHVASANLFNYCSVINEIGAKWCLKNIVKEVKHKNKKSVANFYSEIERYKEKKKRHIGKMSDDDVIKCIMSKKMKPKARLSLQRSCWDFINQIEDFHSKRHSNKDLKPGESLDDLVEMRTRASLSALLPDSNEWLDYYELCKAMHQPDIKDYIKPDGDVPMKTTAEC